MNHQAINAKRNQDAKVIKARFIDLIKAGKASEINPSNPVEYKVYLALKHGRYAAAFN